MSDGSAVAAGESADFSFEHPALRLDGSFFTLQYGSREPIMRVRLGQTDGTAPLRQVTAAFGIKLREIVKANQRDHDFTGQTATAQTLLKTLRWGDIPPAWATLRTTADMAGTERLRLGRFLSVDFLSARAWAGGG